MIQFVTGNGRAGWINHPTSRIPVSPGCANDFPAENFPSIRIPEREDPAAKSLGS
jgi:hypothetical protein